MHELDANTIALWRMDEEDTVGDYLSMADLSGNAYNLTLVGDIQIVGGPKTGLAKFLSGDRFTFPNDGALTDLFLAEWSCEAWVYPNNTVTGYVFSYSSAGESLDSNFLASIQVSSTDTTIFTESGAGTNNSVTSTLAVAPVGTWSHLAVTKTDTGGGTYDYRFYINGVLLDTINSPNSAGVGGGGSQTFTLGANHSGGSAWEGCFGSIRISSGVRSGVEISGSFARAAGDHATDGTTVMYYSMGERPDLFDEANNSHLKNNIGTKESATSLISGGGLSRVFNSTNYFSASNNEHSPAAGLILSALQDEMTIEFWAQLGTTWKEQVQSGVYVFGNPGVETSQDNFFSFDVLNTRIFRIFSEHGGGSNDVWDTALSGISNKNQYDTHHYAITLVASGGFTTFEIYVDGVLLETSDGTDITHGDGTFNSMNIGQGSAAVISNGWLGRIDDMRISDKKRSAAEILESYEAGAPGSPGGPGGLIPPEITNLSPPTMSELARYDSITFDAIDLDSDLRKVLIWIDSDHSTYTRMVFDGTNFLYPFQDQSSFTEISPATHRFILKPTGGWGYNVTKLTVRVVDTEGNFDGDLII